MVSWQVELGNPARCADICALTRSKSPAGSSPAAVPETSTAARAAAGPAVRTRFCTPNLPTEPGFGRVDIAAELGVRRVRRPRRWSDRESDQQDCRAGTVFEGKHRFAIRGKTY